MAEGARIEKLMSLTRAEFVASLAGFDPQARLGDDGVVSLVTAGGVLRVTFEPLPPRLLGGLVRMPQARVALDFSGIPEAQRASLQRRFDIAFQRGGG